jgi:hypothetical protein
VVLKNNVVVVSLKSLHKITRFYNKKEALLPITLVVASLEPAIVKGLGEMASMERMKPAYTSGTICVSHLQQALYTALTFLITS